MYVICIQRFVGMLPSEQLQQFLVRAVTGFGERVQQELTDKDYDDLTSKISNLAGSITLTTYIHIVILFSYMFVFMYVCMYSSSLFHLILL